MKILFIASKDPDYLQDLTYSGLAERLGKENVVDYPRHWQFHKVKKHFWSAANRYPRNLGYNVDSPAAFNDKEIESFLNKNEFDWVALGAAKPDALRTFLEIEHKIKAPWFFIDGGDRTEIGGDFLREGGAQDFHQFQSLCRRCPPALIFKRELAIGESIPQCLPLPFSVNTRQLSILPCALTKRFQVVFWAVESSPIRRKVLQSLRGKYDCSLNGTASGQKFKKYKFTGADYFKSLNQSQVALSFRGEGFDTLRYWEIPACGSLLLSERPLIQIQNNFMDRGQAVFCKNDASDLFLLIDYYLGRPDEACAIAQEGQKHLLAHHTHLHRADYILNPLECV